MLKKGSSHLTQAFQVVLSSVQSLSHVRLLQLREPQHARPPCPSPTAWVHLNSCPLSQWCHPTVSSSVSPSPLPFRLSQHQGLLQWVGSLHQVTKVLEFQLQHQFIQWIFRTDFLEDGLVGSSCSPRDSQKSSPTPQFKASILRRSALFMAQPSHPYMTTGKTIALPVWAFVSKGYSREKGCSPHEKGIQWLWMRERAGWCINTHPTSPPPKEQRRSDWLTLLWNDTGRSDETEPENATSLPNFVPPETGWSH